jgi:YHS domain-containing protein
MRFMISFVMLTLIVAPISASPDKAEPVSDPATYPLSTCVLSGSPLEGEKAVSTEHEGRELRFCGKKCLAAFEKDAADYLKKLDAAIIEDQIPSYPIATCVVTGEAFGGEMGEPANYIYGNRLVRLCCMGCRSSFDKDAESFIAKLDEAAIAEQLGDYPSITCPISGMKLGGMGEPYNYIVAGRLVRLCCAGCAGAVNKDPVVVLATVYGDNPAGEN